MDTGPETGTDLTLFSDVPEGELEEAFARLEVRRYEAGAVLIAEGDVLQELYILRSGSAEVFVADRQGAEHRVAQLAPGATLGEMSLLTAQPAVSTVRASEDAELLALSKEEFDRLAARFPRIYRNVGGILADRLARTNRLTLGEEPGHLSVLVDRGAPPELAYAIAASLAWHAHVPTMLLMLVDEPSERLASIVHDIDDLRGRFPRLQSKPGDARPHLSVKVLDPKLEGRLGEILSELRDEYDHVLLAVRTPPREDLGEGRTIELRAAGGDDGPRTGAYAVEAWAPGHSFVGPDHSGLIQVPALEPADERALSDGVLPSSSAAGRKIGWIARDLAGLKVGVALGAGSVRGFMHFGVLRALERHGIAIDCLAGTSAGAAAAGLYALGNSPDEAAEIFLRCGLTLFRPRISTRSFLSNRGMSKFIRGVAKNTLIEDLPYPFATVAADIDSQREIVFRRGLLWAAVVASSSIPGIYPALRMGPYTVVDGGVLNPVPCSVCADMGANTVIGVKLGGQAAVPNRQATSMPPAGRSPSAIPTIVRALEIMQTRIGPEAVHANTIIITPESTDAPTGSLRSFKAGIRLVATGEEAAEAAMPRLAAALPWIRAR